MSLRIAALAFLWANTLLADQPKRLLFIGQGPDGHPPTTHEYMDGLKVLYGVLKPVQNLQITTIKADGKWENGPELIDRADGIVMFVSEGAKWVSLDEWRLAAFQRAAKRKAGLVVLHWGMGCKDAKHIDDFLALFGGCHGGPDRKYTIVETDVTPEKKHPIAAGIDSFRAKDEFYHDLKFVEPNGSVQPVVTVEIEGTRHTVAWSWDRPGGGRSFGFSGLHFHENWKKTEYRRLVAHAVLWTNGVPVPEKGFPVGE